MAPQTTRSFDDSFCVTRKIKASPDPHNATLSGRGERMRASGPLQREVRRLFALL